LGKCAFSISCAPMRPVSGFERPFVQWIFVSLGAVLVAVAAGEAVGLRRARTQIENLRAANLEDRVRQEQLEERLTRAQATREALTLELARARAGASTPAAQPTLTLTPLTRRGVQPPDATVSQPPAAEAIQLRLVLPSVRATPTARYSITVRTWSGGETVWQRTGLASSTVEGKPMIAAFVTGDVLAAGAYEVILSTAGDRATEIATYEIGVRARTGH
jgi:hypothetical protein